jgi:hypothetical protein
MGYDPTAFQGTQAEYAMAVARIVAGKRKREVRDMAAAQGEADMRAGKAFASPDGDDTCYEYADGSEMYVGRHSCGTRMPREEA